MPRSGSAPSSAFYYDRADEQLFKNVPQELTAYKFWVVWKEAPPDNPDNPKYKKLALNPLNLVALDWNNPRHWSNRATAVEVFQRTPHLRGIGWVPSPTDPYGYFDLDHVIIDDALLPWAAEFVALVNSYTEISAYHDGVKIITRMTLPEGSGCVFKFRDSAGVVHDIEMYDHNHWFAATGEHYAGTPTEIRDAQHILSTNGNHSPKPPETDKPKKRWPVLVSYAAILRAQGVQPRQIYEELRPLNERLSKQAAKTPYPEKKLRDLAKWFEKKEAGIGREPGDEPETKPQADETADALWATAESLGRTRSPVAPFDPQFLPLSFRPLITDISYRMQIPAEMAAAAILCGLAGCVNRRAFIRPKRRDKSWRVWLNLWGLVVINPGWMKSPVLNQVLAPVIAIEAAWRKSYEEDMKLHCRALKEQELRQEHWESEYKRALRAHKTDLPEQPEETVKKPVRKQLYFNDCTHEKLQMILAENPAGLLMIRDEMSGWLAQLDKPGREGERAFMLTSWNGEGSHDIGRVGRDMVFCKNPCISSIGAIQPDPIRRLLQEIADGDRPSDGLIPREQIMVWPDVPTSYEFVDEAASEAAEMMVAKIVNRLVEIDCESPIELRFSDDAQPVFNDWITKLENRIRKPRLGAALIEHISKYKSLVPTIAALYELADLAAAQEFIPAFVTVSRAHLEQAIALCVFLESHAARVYSCITSPEMFAAREIAAHIKAGDLPPKDKNYFAARDVYINNWSGLANSSTVNAGLNELANFNWIRKFKVSNPRGGRTAELWEINPVLPEL
jgi:hypothetical protein